MNLNKKVIVAVMVISASGIANAWINNKPITRVVIGAYVLLLVLSIMDVFGGSMSTLAGGIAMVAMTYVILTEVPWQTIISTVQGGK